MVFACRNRRKWLNYRHFRIWDQMVDGFFWRTLPTGFVGCAVFYSFRARKKFGKGPPRAPTARRKISLATRNFSISKKKQRPIWAKKEEKAFCLRALSSSLYKYTTFFGKKQIVLTFEYNPWNVKKTRFASARRGHALIERSMGGLVFSGIGSIRDKANVAMTNLTYKIARTAQVFKYHRNWITA